MRRPRRWLVDAFPGVTQAGPERVCIVRLGQVGRFGPFIGSYVFRPSHSAGCRLLPMSRGIRLTGVTLRFGADTVLGALAAVWACQVLATPCGRARG